MTREEIIARVQGDLSMLNMMYPDKNTTQQDLLVSILRELGCNPENYEIISENKSSN